MLCRYAFSGVAFSAAKPDLTIEWCRTPDSGLPAPDLVAFLDVSPETAEARGGFGDERYEEKKFQEKVRNNYDLLKDEAWKTIDTNDKTLDQVYQELAGLVKGAIQKGAKHDAIRPLWPIL